MSRTVLGFNLTNNIAPPDFKKRRKPRNKNAGRRPVFPFAAMEIGESFFVPAGVTASISANFANYKGKRFVSRKTVYRNTEGTRVWRVQ